MRNSRALVLMALLVVLFAVSLRAVTNDDGAQGPTTDEAHARELWAQAATRSCERMQWRIGLHGWDYWKPLNVNRPGRGTGLLRREELVIHEDGLREIRSQVRSPNRGQAHALALYARMLTAIRAVIRTAVRGEAQDYYEADVRMRRLIQLTRAAFAREGAGRICDFAI
jgi:hypothetical protein